jgi:hypothetical protein
MGSNVFAFLPRLKPLWLEALHKAVHVDPHAVLATLALHTKHTISVEIELIVHTDKTCYWQAWKIYGKL